MPTEKNCPDCNRSFKTHGKKCGACRKRDWVRKNPEKQKIYNATVVQRRRESSAETRLARHLKYRYHLTINNYFEILDRQNGVCAICGNAPDPGTRLAVDHDHTCCSSIRSCGACVRGLLCLSCNNLLSFANDSESILLRAIGYLRNGGC